MIYELTCTGPQHHEFERTIPLAHYEGPHYCECGAVADMVIRTPRVMQGFDTPAAKYDATIYRQHNVTRETTSVMSDGATVTAKPLSVSDGCTCGNCASHARRAKVTGVAEPGKNR